jgi:hypothetical protein
LTISREERYPHFYENADFLPQAIKTSIEEEEIKTNQAIKAMEPRCHIAADSRYHIFLT